jgi:hypothetical protein
MVRNWKIGRWEDGKMGVDGNIGKMGTWWEHRNLGRWEDIGKMEIIRHGKIWINGEMG